MSHPKNVEIHYKQIMRDDAVKYLKENSYDNFWFDNGDKKFFIRPTHAYGIFYYDKLAGLIIIENWKKFYEAHIFSEKHIRGLPLVKLLRDFLFKKLNYYKMLVGRVKKDRKDVLRLAKWLKFRCFNQDEKYFYMGMSNESIQ